MTILVQNSKVKFD